MLFAFSNCTKIKKQDKYGQFKKKARNVIILYWAVFGGVWHTGEARKVLLEDSDKDF